MAPKQAYDLTPSVDKEHLFSQEIMSEPVLDLVRIADFADINPRNNRPDHPMVSEERVNYYLTMMREGDTKFPPVVAKTLESGGLETLGGNHRLEAARRFGADVIPAYVFPVTLTERQAFDVRVLDNRGHGLDLTKEERIILAAQAIDIHGDTVSAAARKVGLEEHVIRRQRTAAEAEVRIKEQTHLSEAKIRAMPTDVKIALNRVKDRKAYNTLARLTADQKYQTRRVKELAEAVNLEPTQKAKLELLRRETEAVLEEERPRREEYSKVAGALTTLAHGDFLKAKHQARTEDIPVLVDRVTEVYERLGVWRSDLLKA